MMGPAVVVGRNREVIDESRKVPVRFIALCYEGGLLQRAKEMRLMIWRWAAVVAHRLASEDLFRRKCRAVVTVSETEYRPLLA